MLRIVCFHIVSDVMQMLYTRYNRNRRPEFQTETEIFAEDGRKLVAKRALTGRAEAHIAAICARHEFVGKNIISENLKLPEIIRVEESSVILEYVEGMTLDALMFEAVLNRDKPLFFSFLDEYRRILTGCFKVVDSFAPCVGKSGVDSEFCESLYDGVDIEVVRSEKTFFQCAVMDAVFDNIIVKDRDFYLIDNEWVFHSIVPVSFVAFRSLTAFYSHKHDYGVMSRFLPFEELLGRFGISPGLAAVYAVMDDNFQNYVIGPAREYQIKKNYIKAADSLSAMEARLAGQQSHIAEVNALVEQAREHMRLLGSKEIMLEAILHSKSWRVTRKLCDIVDLLLPADSLRRRLLVAGWRCIALGCRAPWRAFSRVCRKHGRSILFVDDRVPHFDRDAGSQTAFAYLKLLAGKGFKVKFLGDTFHRHEPYASELEKLGVEILAGPWYKDHWPEWALENASDIKYVFLNRPHIAIKYIDFFKEKTDAKILYYGHDLHWLRYKRLYELGGSVDALKQSEYWKGVEDKICSTADVVYFPSETEISLVRKSVPRAKAHVLPAYIYESHRLPAKTGFNTRQDLLFVGGFAHTPNEDAVKWFAAEVMPLIIRLLPEVRFVVVGGGTESANSFASDNFVVKGRVSADDLAAIYAKTRIVVVPLRYGAGVKGKTVEAMAYGVPVVSTSVGVEGLPGIDGVVPVEDTPQGFAERVVMIYRDKEQWTNLSEKSREYVLSIFSLKKAEQALSSDIDWP